MFALIILPSVQCVMVIDVIWNEQLDWQIIHHNNFYIIYIFLSEFVLFSTLVLSIFIFIILHLHINIIPLILIIPAVLKLIYKINLSLWEKLNLNFSHCGRIQIALCQFLQFRYHEVKGTWTSSEKLIGFRSIQFLL